LIVEDNPGDARLVREALRDAEHSVLDSGGGFRTTEVPRVADAIAALGRGDVDLVLLDLALPDSEGFSTFERVRDADPDVPIVVFTRLDDASIATRAMRSGAQDYLPKSHLDAESLLRSVRYATERKQADRDRAALQREQVARAEAEAQRSKLDALAAERAQLLAREQAARAAAEQAHQRAEEANRAKDEFLATVSHELRTPLNAILGWTRLLQAGQLPEARRAGALEAIERNGRSQAQLIDDILDVARIISGKLRVDFREVDPEAVVAAAVDVVRPTAGAKSVELVVNRTGDKTGILGDPDRLQQIVWNLLTNALKFTPAGGRVEASVAHRGDTVVIEVSDTGQGIAAEFLPHAFERFRQADSAPSRTHGGLGLGLAIVRHLVDLHGGTVGVRSPGLGRGSTFTVRLPSRPPVAAHPQDAVPQGPSETPRQSAPEQRLEGLRVVVVEDDDDAREVVAMALEQHGAIVTKTSTAAAALDELRRERPDVLVSDIGLPREDGYALIAKVRAGLADAAVDVPAVALTAYARAEDARKAIAAGFQVHAAKPLDLDALVSLVARLAGRDGPGAGPPPTRSDEARRR
ncbi:MAG TPA: response regulator, partial [Polyangiaceae bacterium]|nr:response regulator [Polyangiaceae bacterium]